MAPTTLPVGLLAHILDLFQFLDPIRPHFTPLYQDLYHCCLVSRAFFAPARAALYRTIQCTFYEFGGSDTESDGGEEADSYLSSPVLNSIIASLSRYSHLGRLAVFGDMRKAQIEELGELLQSCNIRLRRLDLQHYFMTKENARESVALLLRSQELQHLDLWTGYPHTLPSPPPSFALRSLSINFSDPERANYLLASSRTTLHSLQLRVQSYERDRIDLSAFPFLTSLSLFYTTPDTISNGLNLSLCTSIRHLHLEVSPPPSFAWSPSLDSLTIRNKPLPLATLLDFLHSPQSSQLRQIRFPTHASYPHALPSWRLDEVEEMLDVCEQRGVWVQLEGKKGLKGLEKLCEQRGVWTMLENGWAS